MLLNVDVFGRTAAVWVVGRLEAAEAEGGGAERSSGELGSNGDGAGGRRTEVGGQAGWEKVKKLGGRGVQRRRFRFSFIRLPHEGLDVRRLPELLRLN